MAKLNFAEFTPPAHEVAKMSELIFLDIIRDGNIKELFTFLTGQENGKKVGLVTGFGLLGKTDEGCDSNYDDNIIGGSEEEWEIKRWAIKEALCYEDLEGTIAAYALREGVNVGDLSETEYMTLVVEPALRKAIEELILRLAFFGNKTISQANLKSPAKVENFNTIDGVWKRIFDGVAAGTISKTDIVANTKTTIAAQKEAMRADGVATKIIEDILADAPAELQQSEQKLIMTLEMWNAWKNDVRRNNKGSEGQWESLFAGVKKGEIDGVTTYVVPFLDKIIKTYEVNETNSGAWNKPYRVILTAKENNLLLGTTNTQENFDTIDIFFDKKDDKTYIKAKDTLGAMILSHDYIHVAF